MKKSTDEPIKEAIFEKGAAKEKREITLAMPKENLPIKEVSKLTGLSVKEIQSLQS